MYLEYISNHSDSTTYKRKSLLDEPQDDEFMQVDTGDDPDLGPSKLTREQELEDYEIKLPFIAGAEMPQY